MKISRATMLSGGSRRQRGITLPMTALFIVVLFTFAALAVDVGVFYTARTSAQHAADAAALAGAYTFVTAAAADHITVAANAAKAVAAENSILGKPVNLDDATIVDAGGGSCPAPGGASFICIDSDRHRVTVNIASLPSTTLRTYFARIFYSGTVSLGVVATAEAAKTPGGVYCLRPFYMTMSTGGGCDPGFFNADGTLNGDYVGKEVTLWQQDPKWSSEFGLLNLSGEDPHGQGSIVPYIESCDTSVQYSCSDQFYNVDNGKRPGQIEPAVNNLINYPDNDVWGGMSDAGEPIYITPSGEKRDTSRSVQTVVIWDCSTPIGNGSNSKVKVGGYGEVFIESVDKNGIHARLINAGKCRAGGGGSNGTGPFSIPVRLIQTPSSR